LGRAGDGIHTHADQAAGQNIARESCGPGAGNFLGERDDLRPSLLIVTVMSALRFACTTHGVTQAVGISRPDISAVAPAGVVEIEMFSVVPRVTDAQPKHGKAIAADNNNLITEASPARQTFHATST
jgi:hypothetical protein